MPQKFEIRARIRNEKGKWPLHAETLHVCACSLEQLCTEVANGLPYSDGGTLRVSALFHEEDETWIEVKSFTDIPHKAKIRFEPEPSLPYKFVYDTTRFIVGVTGSINIIALDKNLVAVPIPSCTFEFHLAHNAPGWLAINVESGQIYGTPTTRCNVDTDVIISTRSLTSGPVWISRLDIICHNGHMVTSKRRLRRLEHLTPYTGTLPSIDRDDASKLIRTARFLKHREAMSSPIAMTTGWGYYKGPNEPLISDVTVYVKTSLDGRKASILYYPDIPELVTVAKEVVKYMDKEYNLSADYIVVKNGPIRNFRSGAGLTYGQYMSELTMEYIEVYNRTRREGRISGTMSAYHKRHDDVDERLHEGACGANAQRVRDGCEEPFLLPVHAGHTGQVINWLYRVTGTRDDFETIIRNATKTVCRLCKHESHSRNALFRHIAELHPEVHDVVLGFAAPPLKLK